MLHGPCGAKAKHAPCNNEGKCSKHFPKKFLAETIINEDGYPVYRRRDNKITPIKGKFTYNNKHVVPHNRYLLLKYHAHINFEWCNRSKVIKYLFKYLNKGPDRVTISIQENVKASANGASDQIMVVDEIKNYLNCRFLSPCEAVWRLFLFDINYAYPTVMQLNYHLPEQNAITLRDSKELPALLERECISITIGARSFTELKMVNKINYATFKAACFAYGLLNDDKEWTHAITEASFWAMAPQLRELFVTILLFYFNDLPQPNPKLLTNLDNRLLREALALNANKSIASLLLPAGRTTHSRFVIPLKLMENSTCGIKQNTHLAKLMQHVRLITWEEAPMTQRYAFEALDKTNDGIAGRGLSIVLPVIPNAKRPEVIQACLNQSELWKYCKVFTLTRRMRVNEYACNGEIDNRKQDFNRWVIAVGDGKLPAKKKESEDEPTWIEILEEFLIKS
ncbi:ATP-dependent DNA helicase PIF1-like protein [Tanacetum coccineum]|uniref:ATP-dependent DNA helicase n=1 Tax=Tanacetum coccineum TaxID=301880 RepID=A0ABQ5EH23_9ASTR